MAEDEEVSITPGTATIQDRIAAWRMLDDMTTATLAEKSYRLHLCGFKRGDIALMLGIGVASVSTNISSEKKKGPKPRGKKGE